MAPGLSDTLTHHPLLALATLFGAGAVTSLTPCIYPMIPITAGIISGTSAPGTSRARTAGLTLAYVIGLALFYAILGLIAGLSGSIFGTIGANRWALLAIGNLLLVFALAMLEVIPVRMPMRLMTWAANRGGGSYPAVFPAAPLAPPSELSGQDVFGIAVGKKPPMVTLETLSGDSVALSTWIGKKPVIVEFWATWCPICAELLPRMEAAHKKYRS